VSNGSDINEVLRPLNILGSDIWERSLADGLFDGLLYWFLAKAAEHGRKKERINKKRFYGAEKNNERTCGRKEQLGKRQIPDFFSCTLHNTAFLSPSQHKPVK